jgi:2-keto-4-pentenoate hydratase/2-oxohepta-3-ene-1,7-dioic acid hydratase in catechol pathway
VTRYVRYRYGSTTSFGILDGDAVRELAGGLFQHRETGAVLPLAAVKLLAPIVPGKIMAVGLNYRSHLGGRPQPKVPEIFYKPVSALQDPDGPVVLPHD